MHHATTHHAVEPLEPRRLLSTAPPVNVLIHDNGPTNTGDYFNETVLTPANVNAADFGQRYTDTLDGNVYAQPLYVQNQLIIRGSSIGIHSVLYVATMHDSLYAIDANTGAILWQDNFLNTTDPTNLTPTSGVTTVPSSDASGTIPNPELGILATPAIDLSRGEIFLNAATKEIRGTDRHYVQRLWAVNLADGSIAGVALIADTISNNPYTDYTGYEYVGGPIVDGSGNNANPTTYPNTDGWAAAPGGATVPVIAFNAIEQMQRTAVTLLNGAIYLGFASHGDEGPYYGWVLGYSESNLALTAAFVTTPTYEDIPGDRPDYMAQGGIWASAATITTDGTYLYLTTGNGAFNISPSNFNAQGFPIDHDYGDSLLKLAVDPSSSPTNQNGNGWGLTVADYFTPSNAESLNTLDLDFGSGAVTLLPDTFKDAAGNPMLVVGGKESRIYLIDVDNLGKFNFNAPTTGNPDPRNYDNVLGEYAGDGLNGTAYGIYGAAAYFNGDFYITQRNAPALVFNIDTFASGTIPPGTTYTPTPVQETPSFAQSYSTFAISANGNANGIVWSINVTPSELLAFDASNMTSPIYGSATNSADNFSNTAHFAVPTIANGFVYLGDANDQLIAYALHASYLSSNSTYFSAPTNLTATQVSSTDIHLSWISNSTLASEFRIDRSPDGQTWSTIAYVGNASDSYDDTTITPSTSYQYRVVAISGPAATATSNIAIFSPTGTASVSGTVSTNTGSSLSDLTLYIDANNNSQLDAGELTTTTDSSGAYAFANLPAGAYIIRQILPTGDTQITPANNLGHHVTLAAGSAITAENFIDSTAGATIAGTVTANGRPVANETLYLDTNNDSKLDEGEQTTTTNAAGVYTFTNVPPGATIVRQILPTGYTQTSPSENFGHHVTPAAGQQITGEDFLDAPSTASIAGTVFNDANGDGIQDDGETGLAGWTVYIDINNTGVFATGDPTTTTDSSGDYLFSNLAPAAYIVRVQRPAGFTQTSPANNFGHHATLAAAQQLTGENFGEMQTA